MRDYPTRVRGVNIWPLLVLTACTGQASAQLTGSSEAPDAVDPGVVSEPILADGPIETVTLDLTADTSIRSWPADRNYGSADSLDVNRALVIVEQTTLKAALPDGDYVESAKLRFNLVPTLLPRLPRNLSAHRVLKAWTEGGATWNCAIDSNTGNSSADCSGDTRWSSAGGDFEATPTDTTVIP